MQIGVQAVNYVTVTVDGLTAVIGYPGITATFVPEHTIDTIRECLGDTSIIPTKTHIYIKIIIFKH